MREGLTQLWLTVKRARRVSNVALFLLARMLYTDAKVAILAYSGIYAAGVFGWELAELLLFAVLLAPFSISGGFIGGWLDNRLGSKRAIQISVGTDVHRHGGRRGHDARPNPVPVAVTPRSRGRSGHFRISARCPRSCTC